MTESILNVVRKAVGRGREMWLDGEDAEHITDDVMTALAEWLFSAREDAESLLPPAVSAPSDGEST